MTYDYEGLNAGYYDFRRPGLRKRWHDRKFNTVAIEVEKTNPDIVIDLGCGPGVFIRDHCQNIKLKIGFDISTIQVAYAKQFENDRTFFFSNLSEVGEVIRIRKSQSPLNITLTSIELIEHISDDVLKAIATKIIDLVKPFVINEINCVFTTPNKNSSWPLVELIIDFLLGTDYRIQHSNLNSALKLKERLSTLSINDLEIFSFLGFRQWLIGRLPLKLYSRAKWRGMILIAKFKMKIEH